VPGQRTFYLQARDPGRLVSFKLEKQQVAAIGQLLGELLSDLPAPGPLPDELELEEPVTSEWSIGTMQLAYDAEADRVVLVAEEATSDEDDAALSRLTITREQAAAMVGRSEALVTSGRPPCPLCGFPLDPAGHSCPKTNGHGPPKL
jgi:uncharacterized repeat protein (TIGR03847 family)